LKTAAACYEETSGHSPAFIPHVNAVFSAPHPGKDHVVGVAVFPDWTKPIIIDKTPISFFYR
jgi:hypothetical protein